MRKIVFLLLAALYVLHNDLWLWHDASLVAGMPVGMFYHIAFCGVVMAAMGLLVKFAWPAHLDDEAGEEHPR